MDHEELREEIDLETYKGEVMMRLTEAWDLAKTHVKKAQQAQKKQYDQGTKPPTFKVGGRVFVYMPGAKACKAYKFSRPFHGPYRVVSMSETGMIVRPVDQPQSDTIRVAYNRVRHCPEHLADTFWPTKARGKSMTPAPTGGRDGESTSLKNSSAESAPNVWRGRLRSRQSDEDALQKSGDV